MHRLIFSLAGMRHTIYLTVADGIIQYAPPVFGEWIGKSLVEVRATLPKSHKYQVWGEKKLRKKKVKP